MRKIFSIIIDFTILFLCFGNTIAQVKKEKSPKVNKAFISENSLLKLKFELSFQSNLQMNFLPNKYKNDKNILLPVEMLPAFYKQKNNLSMALQLQRKWLNENKLGVVGKILGYANFAAVGYLLYTHLKKYKDDY